MAKKAATNRVHKIAKDLGVNSKDIIAKCKSEGIPNIKTYQSAVSAGLEATIKEWFSEAGEKSSAVETAEKVDISKVKAKKKTKKKESKKKTSKKKTSKKNKAKDDEQEKTVPQGRVLETPVKAKMSGPRVIRIEEPEPEPKPRQQKRRPTTQSQGPQGGAGVRMPQQMPPQQDTGRGSKRNKRRDTSQTRQPERGSRNQNQPQDRSQSNWRKQDLLERENRLRRSGGFFRQARRDSQKRDNKPAEVFIGFS